MKRVATNTLILVGVNLSGAVFGFLISVIIGRALGDARLGRFSLVMAWTFALGIFAEFGLNTLIARDVARRREDADRYLVASTIAKIALSLVLIAALEMTAPTLVREEETIVALRLGALLILLNALYGSFTAIFRAFERMLPILILNSGGLLVQLAGTWTLLANGHGVLALVTLAILVQSLQIAAAFLIYRTALPHRAGQIQLDTALILQLLRAAVPFAIAGIISAVEMRLNVVLLSLLEGERAVGWYSAAARFTEAVKFLPNAFFGAIFPAFSAMSARVSNVDLENNYRRTRWTLTLFAFAVAIALSALAQPAIAQSFGSAFENAEPVLIILAWSLIPTLVNGLTILYLYARGDEVFANKMMGLALLFQILAAIPLIRLFGAPGAALSAFFGDIVLWVLLQKGLVVDPFRYASRFSHYVFHNSRTSALLAILIFGTALFVRLFLIWQTKFDGLYGQDSFAYLDYAAAMKTSLARGELPPPFFWPIGYPTLVAIGSAILPIAISAQAVSVIASALISVLTFLMTQEILRDQLYAVFSSTMAALIVACAGQMLVSSLSSMSDAAGIFWATLSAFALMKFQRDSSNGWLVLAAFTLGWAVMTRWIYALLIPVWIAMLLTNDHRRIIARQSLAFAAIAATFFCLGLSPQIALMLYHITHGAISHVGDLQTVGWNLMNAWQSDILNNDGHFIYAKPIAAFYAMPLAHPSFIVPFLTPLILLGAWALRRKKFYLILLVGWISMMWFFLAGIAWENWRFPLAYLPPLAILVGVGFDALAVWISKTLVPNKVVGAACSASLIFTLAWGVRDANNFAAQQRADRVIANWASSHVPTDATVIAFEITETLKHFTALNVVEIFNETPESLEGLVRKKNPVFLLLNVDQVEAQWSGQAPQINFRALRNYANLSRIAAQGPYTLFSMGGSP